MPEDLPRGLRRVVFLWQPPSAATLRVVGKRYPDAPILVGRFEAETPVYAAGGGYWAPTDFFDLRTMIGFELATLDARAAWAGPAEPDYEGMSLVDGDFARMGCWFELVAAAAMLLHVRRVAPEAEVISDWMGVQVAAAMGFRTRRLWRADLADPNWPARRWIRERMGGLKGRSAATTPGAGHGGANCEPADVVFVLAGWVERRLLDGFPIELLASEGHRCTLWVSRRSADLDALVARTGVTCEPLAFPEAAGDVADLERRVADWCAIAAAGGYFAPLRGPLAARVVGLINWPRWSGKLVAMHRLMTARLERQRPRLVVAPAEKDWPAYCAHHATRRLGISSVGFRHGGWPAGTYPERYDHRWLFPPAAAHVLAYTPADARLCAAEHGVGEGTVVWRGNLRLDKPQQRVPDHVAEPFPRVLIGAHGTGAGSPMSLRRRTRPLNTRLISALYDWLGDRVRVRAHPWDQPAEFPEHLRSLFLPQGGDLDEQIAAHAAMVTTYSTIALDAAACGRPVFLWDYAGFGYERAEAAMHGAMIAVGELNALCDVVARFVEDPAYRRELIERAARFPEYLRADLPGGAMRESLAGWLNRLITGSTSLESSPPGQTRVMTPALTRTWPIKAAGPNG